LMTILTSSSIANINPWKSPKGLFLTVNKNTKK
jgi:hypothetical protein